MRGGCVLPDGIYDFRSAGVFVCALPVAGANDAQMVAKYPTRNMVRRRSDKIDRESECHLQGGRPDERHKTENI